MANKGAYFETVSIASGESTSKETEIEKEQLGNSASLSGVVNRGTTSYDVDIEWLTDAGNVAYTESVASGVAAGTETTFDVAARSHRANVVVSDAGSGSGDVTGSAHIS